MKTFRSILPALVALIALAPGSANASVKEDSVDVDHVIAAYHEAVVSHDAERLKALFVEGSAWFSALTDEGLQRVRARKPETPRMRPGSVHAFAEMVASKATQLDPRHTDLKIWTDGTVAAVTFKFRFFADGRETNRGSESWQLIKGDDGWRIVSIIYSSAPPAG